MQKINYSKYIFFIAVILLIIGAIVIYNKMTDGKRNEVINNLSGLQIDNTFDFGVIYDKDFDSIHIVKPYDHLHSTYIHLSPNEREILNSATTLVNDHIQTIIFTKEHRIVDYFSIYTNVLDFSELETQGFSRNTKFKVVKDESNNVRKAVLE